MNDLFLLSRSKNGYGFKLASKLGILHFSKNEIPKLENLPSNFIGINYGVGSAHFQNKDLIRALNWINNPLYIHRSVNKITCFDFLTQAGIDTVEVVDNKETAHFYHTAGYTVYCRTETKASKGKGIIVVHPEEDLMLEEFPEAELYTLKPEGKIYEFRVHVFKDQIVDVTEKRKKGKDKLKLLGLESANTDVRNLSGGWVFCRKTKQGDYYLNIDSDLINNLKDTARASLRALELDYGAVDVLVAVYKNPVLKTISESIKVLEVNTAPAMMPSTIDLYVSKFNEVLE